MALSDTKKNLLLGASVGDTLQNADDNFTSLFDSIDELNDKIPTQTSELTNNSGFITKDVNNLTNYTVKGETGTDIELTVDADYKMTLNLKNSAGTVVSTATVDLPIESLVMNATYADGTLTLTLQNGTEVEVDISALISGLVPDTRTINGKNLKSNVTLTQDDVGDGTTYVRTENNYTDTEKSKLAGIAIGANKYEHPKYTAKSSGLYKITVDATGHISATTAVTKTDITGLGIPAQDTTYTNATTSKAGLMSASDKTKLDAIDESLQGVTADEIGRVKDVTLNGTSVLGADGTASLVIDDLASEYTPVTASVSKAISGTTYYGFNVAETDTAFEVYNTSGQQIVTQRVRADGNIFVACSTTSGKTFTVRKLGGGMIGGAGNAPVALLAPAVTLEAYDNGESDNTEVGSSVEITNPNPFAVTYHICIKNITYATSNPTSSNAYYFTTGTLQANASINHTFSRGDFTWNDLHNAKAYLTHESGFQSPLVDKSVQDE